MITYLEKISKTVNSSFTQLLPVVDILYGCNITSTKETDIGPLFLDYRLHLVFTIKHLHLSLSLCICILSHYHKIKDANQVPITTNNPFLLLLCTYPTLPPTLLQPGCTILYSHQEHIEIQFLCVLSRI